MGKQRPGILVYIGFIVAILLVVAAFSFAHGNTDGRWRSGYGAGYEEGWQAAYIHFAEGGE